jgi:proline dehydrogenase
MDQTNTIFKNITADQIITFAELLPHRELLIWLKGRINQDQYIESCKMLVDIISTRLKLAFDNLIEVENFDFTPYSLTQIQHKIDQIQTSKEYGQLMEIFLEKAMLDIFDITVAKYNLDLNT